MQFPLVVGSILLAPLLAYAHSVLYGANYSNYSYLVVFFLAHLVFHGLSRPYAVGSKKRVREILVYYTDTD